MSDFDDYRGNGTVKFPNPQARQIAINKLLSQGFIQVHSKPLSPMTFMITENPHPDALNPRYMIEYKSY